MIRQKHSHLKNISSYQFISIIHGTKMLNSRHFCHDIVKARGAKIHCHRQSTSLLMKYLCRYFELLDKKSVKYIHKNAYVSKFGETKVPKYFVKSIYSETILIKTLISRNLCSNDTIISYKISTSCSYTLKIVENRVLNKNALIWRNFCEKILKLTLTNNNFTKNCRLCT